MSEKGRRSEHLTPPAPSKPAPRSVHRSQSRSLTYPALARHRELLDAIDDLGARVDRLTLSHATSPSISPSQGPEGSDTNEVAHIRDELGAILAAIESVKHEIADLRRDHSLLKSARERAAQGADPFEVLASATDSANAAILAATERIDDVITTRRADATADEARALNAIGDDIVRIFEACNVHDFVSLRVGRFLTIMRRIEARLRRLSELVESSESEDAGSKPSPRLRSLSS